MTDFASRFTISNAIAASLTTIERARGFLEAATLSAEWIHRMSQRALLLEAHATTHIEGTELTIEQAERLWTGEAVEEAKPDDVRELLNYRDAFHFVSEYLDSGDPITEGLIREIHRRLVEGVRGGEGAPGSYRAIQNHVVNSVTRKIVYTPPPPGDVAPMMRDLVEWLRSDSGVPCCSPSGTHALEPRPSSTPQTAPSIPQPRTVQWNDGRSRNCDRPGCHERNTLFPGHASSIQEPDRLYRGRPFFG